MTASLQLTAHDRVLVCAPHPDDETLATGELIQCARGAGARVRVVFATDGDNNPWPQRWLECRWRIGAAERARWGARRQREALAALGVLGVEESSARFLGWPDQGLTECLMRDDVAIDALSREISGFMPTHIAMPTRDDRHPDHSALSVMLELALRRSGIACTRLGYVVHGASAPAIPRVVARDATRQMLKQRAMLAHASQIALSRRRLLDLAARPERFDAVEGMNAAALPQAQQTVIELPHRPNALLHRREDLLVVLMAGHEIVRFRVPLPQRARAARPAEEYGHFPAIEWTADTLNVTLPATRVPVAAVFAKRERVGARLVVFDREGWRDTAQLLRVPMAIVGGQAATSLI